MSTLEPTHIAWRKSTHSGGDEGNCIEIAELGGQIGLRDSKAPDTGHLVITRRNFTALLNHLAKQL